MGKRNNGRKITRIGDKNMLVGWTPMQQCTVNEDAEKNGVVANFQNNKYTVFVKQAMSDAFGQQMPDGKVVPAEIIHLLIVRNDNKGVRSWEDLQRIKDEILGPNAEAVELFPSRERLVESKQTHLWVLPPGMMFPIGLIPEGLAALARAEQEAQEKTMKKEDLEVFVVMGDSIEVFESEEEAKAMYEENGNDIPEGKSGVEMIGEVPLEEDGALWTDKAKAKAGQVLRRIEEIDAHNKRVDDAIVVDIPDDDHGTIEDEMGDYEDGPVSVEETIDMERIMKEGIKAKQDARKAAIARASEIEVESEEDEEQSEQEAADELKKMREEMRNATKH
jgi:hypothetical protein